LAVDEDPLRELKNVRREVRRLRQRVSILETEAHDRDGTLGWLKTFNGLALIALVMFILSKKKP
jgi:hypothetical protein